MSTEDFKILIGVLVSLIGSSGFWAYMLKKIEKKNAKNDKTDYQQQMLLGIGYAMIMIQGEKYICRGWITREEIKYFREYLYNPYKGLNGDGAGDDMMESISRLQVREVSFTNRQEVCSNAPQQSL